jgi:Txe/YoeB family toxin of toxin-antitoxin system
VFTHPDAARTRRTNNNRRHRHRDGTVHFSDDGWDDYLHWTRTDPGLHRRLNELIEDVRRHPFMGLGKPEALKGDLSGWCTVCRAARTRTSASRSSSADTITEPISAVWAALAKVDFGWSAEVQAGCPGSAAEPGNR